MDGGDSGRFRKSSLGEKIPVPPLKPLKLDDVPMWTLLPYDTKYPLTEYSKKVFTREEIGKSLYPTFPSKEFDLSQSPVPVVERTHYDSLHDPHLRQYFHHAWRYRNLVRKGVVTKDGKVKSRLRDYNQYRMYLYHLWAMQVNQLNRTQMLEEKKRLENILKAHESGDSLFKDVAQKYDKIKIEEILDEVTFKMTTDGAVLKKYCRSPLIQSAIQWKTYQEKLKKNFRLSYPAVKQWLCEQTRHYKQFIERKLNARRNREKKNRGRWEKICENSFARLQKELKLQAQEKEKKRELSEQRYNRAKIQWEKNERKISLRSKSSASKSFTDLSLAYCTGLRERNITDVVSTSSPDVSAVEKYLPASSKKLQKLYQVERIDFKQRSTILTQETNFNREKQKMKFEKLTINENEVTNNLQRANYTNEGHGTTFQENYHNTDDGAVGKKSESIRSTPKEERKIDKEIIKRKSKEVLDVEESAHLPSRVSKYKIGKKGEMESFEKKSPTVGEQQTKTDYRKALPALGYFDSNVDQGTPSNFHSFKKDKRTIFAENYQTLECGAVGKISENTETIPQERKISNEIVVAEETEYLPTHVSKHKIGKKEELDHFQKKSPTGRKKQTKTDYKKELLKQGYFDSNIDQNTSSHCDSFKKDNRTISDENYQTDDGTFGRKFESTESLLEEEKIRKKITDGEPNEILDVEEIEYLPTNASERKIGKKEEFNSFQTKSPTRGDKQMETDYGKELPTQGYFDSNIDQDTSFKFDSFKKDNRTIFDENYQTDYERFGQKFDSAESIPEEEKIGKQITDGEPNEILDVEEIEYLPTHASVRKIGKKEEFNSFQTKSPTRGNEQTETDYGKESPTQGYFGSNIDQDTSFKKDNRTIFDENYQTDNGRFGQKFKSAESIPEEEKIGKEITDGEPNEILDVEEIEYLPTHASERKIGKKEEFNSFQTKSPTRGDKQMKTDYGKELPTQGYFGSNIDQDTSFKFDSFKKDNRTIFDENYQTDDGRFRQKFKSAESIPEEEITDGEPNEILDVEEIEYLPTHASERKIRKKEEFNSFQTKSPTRGDEQMETDYGKELPTQGYFDSNIDQDTSFKFDSFKKDNRTIFDENYQTDDGTFGQKFESTGSIPEEEKIGKEITDGEPNEILDVEEIEYLPTHASECKIGKKEEINSFQTKSPTRGEEQMVTDCRKAIPTQGYFHSNIYQDTSSNFDSFKKDNRTIYDENDQTLDNSTVGQKSKSFENIPYEERKNDKEITDSPTIEVSDVKQKTELLSSTSGKFQKGGREELDSFLLKTLIGEVERVNTDYKKEIPTKENHDFYLISGEAEIRKETNMLGETDEDPSRHRNYLNGLQDTDDKKGFPETEYESDVTPLQNENEPQATNSNEKSKDIPTDEKLIARKDFDSDDTSVAAVLRQSALGEDQLKLRDYLYGLPEFNKKYTTGNETALEIQKFDIQEKVILKENTHLIEKADIPTLLKLSLGCLTERGNKKDSIWKALEAFYDKKKKELQKNIGLENTDLITWKTEKLNLSYYRYNYKCDTEPTFGKTVRNRNCKFCSHTDMKRDFSDVDEKIDYIQYKTIFKNGIKQNKIIPTSPEIPTKWFKKDSSRGNTLGYEKMNEYKTDNDNYSFSDSKENAIKHIINKHILQNRLNELTELTNTYKTRAARTRQKNKLENLIYFPEEAPELISETKEYQKSIYLNSEFYKTRKEILDLEFYDWYLKGKMQSNKEMVKGTKWVHSMYYNFSENESDLQILPSPAVNQDTDSLKDHLDTKECKKEYTTSTQFVRDTKLENESLSPVYNGKYDNTGFLSEEKTHKIHEQEKYSNTDMHEPVTEDNNCKKYIYSSGKSTIADISKDVQKLHSMHYDFSKNESDLQTLPSPVVNQDTGSLKGHLDTCQMHFNKECKKDYTTSTLFVRDTKLENESLSPVYKGKYDNTGFLSDEKTHKIHEQEKYSNIDLHEPVTEDNNCKKYIYSTGKSTITDISKDVQKLEATTAVSQKILDSPKLEMQKDSKFNMTCLEKIIDEILKEIEIKQINDNADVTLSDNVLTTQPRQSVAHKERLEYEQLDFAKPQGTEDTSNDMIKTTVKKTALSENEQSSEKDERMQKLKYLNGMRIIKQYPPEDPEGLSSHLKHELNVKTKANSEETNLRENLIEKRHEETDICSISTNIEKNGYNSTAVNKDSTKENQNKITESYYIVNTYDKNINVNLKPAEKAEKTAYTTYELPDSNHDKKLHHEDNLVKSHILFPASLSYSPDDSVKEKSSFNFKSDIHEDLKIFQRGHDSDAKGTLEGQDGSHIDIRQSHNLSVSQTDEFDDDLMRKTTEILKKDNEKCNLNRTDLTASVLLTVDNKSAEMKQKEIKIENQNSIDNCEDIPLFELNDQLGFFYNLTKPIVSKNCEITVNMKKWAPVNSGGRTRSLLQKKSLRKKTEIAKVRSMFFKRDDDFILPSAVRCLDASDISDMAVEIQPTSMVSFIESRKQDRIEKKFGQVSEQLKSEMNAEKHKDNIEMNTKVDKKTLKTRLSDSKYIRTTQNKRDNSCYYQIKSDKSYKTKYHQKDKAQIKNYKFFELEEKHDDLNSATDFLFSVHSHNQKTVPDTTDLQLLQVSFDNLTINDPGAMQINVSEKDMKQSLPAMDKCKDKTCSKITRSKKETICDPKLKDLSHKLATSIKSEIYESTLPQITNENTDLPRTDNFTNILIINEANNKLPIPDSEPRNSNDLKCNFDLIQNVSKHKIVNSNMECTNRTQISPIHAPYESIKADEISEHLSKKRNTVYLVENEDSDNSIKHENQFEIIELNPTGQQETIESFNNDIEDSTNLKTQAEYNDNNLTPDILILNRHTDKEISITRNFFSEKSSSSTQNLNSISLNIKFSDSPINDKLNSYKFKIFLNNCISEILQKCKISKSAFLVDESDSNTDTAPKKFSDCTLDTNSEYDLSKIEPFPQKIKKQQTDNVSKNTYSISPLPGESRKNLPTNVQKTEYSSKADERSEDKERDIYSSVNDIFYQSEGFSNEVRRKDVDIPEVLNESQIPKNQEETNTNIEIESPEECYDTHGKVSRNYQERKSFMRKVMDPITRRRDSIPHKEKIERTGYQTTDKQHSFKNTDIFITKDIKSFTNDFKDDSNNQKTYHPRSLGKADEFEGKNANSTLQTNSNEEKIFETNSKFVCSETSNNEESSGLNKEEGLLPIISTARLINMNIMDIAEERAQSLKCHLKENQEKLTNTSFIDDDQDKS